MNRVHLFLADLLIAGLLLAAPSSAQAPVVIDQGRLEYRLSGNACGHEDFVVEETDRQLIWRSSSELTVPGSGTKKDEQPLTIKVKVRAAYSVVNGLPVTLQDLREEVDAGSRAGGIWTIFGNFEEPGCQMVVRHPEFEVKVPLYVSEEAPAPITPLVVLDGNGGYAIYGAVAAMATSRIGEHTHKRVIVPQAEKLPQSPTLDLAVTLLAEQGSARKIEIETYGGKFEVRMGAGRLRIEKISIPAQNFEAVRIADRAQSDPGRFDEAQPPPLQDDPESPKEATATSVRGTDEPISLLLEGALVNGSLRRPHGSALTGALGVPAMLFVSDAGMQDRDGHENGHAVGQGLFAVLADALARRGVASLRFDDPGVGESTGDLTLRDLRTRVADATMQFQLALSTKGIDLRRVGVLGHGEGGQLAPLMVIDQRLPIDLLVLVNAPGRPLSEMMTERAELRLRSMRNEDAEHTRKYSEAALATALRDRQSLFKQIQLGSSWDSVILFNPGAEEGYLASELEQWKATAPFSYYQQHFSKSPREMMLLVDAPVLLVAGGKDLEVSPDNSRELDDVLAKAGQKAHELWILPFLDHRLKAPHDDAVDAVAVERIAAWVARRFETK